MWEFNESAPEYHVEEILNTFIELFWEHEENTDLGGKKKEDSLSHSLGYHYLEIRQLALIAIPIS